jgi:hypothetical protein
LSIANLETVTGCVANKRSDVRLLLPKGWELYRMLNFSDPNPASVGPLPFAALLLQPAEGKLVRRVALWVLAGWPTRAGRP